MPGRRAPEHAGAPQLLVVGLGNPTEEYAGTRHNLGAEVVEVLAARHGGHLRRSRERARTCEVRVDGARMALAVPLTWVNESGNAVGALVRRYHVEPAQLVVVHDELDLPPGQLRVKVGGGTAGHNGLRSIEQHLKTRDFLRVRIGIGKPPDARRGADYVLDRFSKRERQEISVVVEEAADAVETILRDGVERAMNRFNSRAS